MRALIILNENPLGSHPDVYEAFELLVQEGLLSGYDVVPFLHLRADGQTDHAIVQSIVAAANGGGHGLIIWMHTGSLHVDDASMERIRSAPSRPKMVYWEGDSYHPFYKPMPRAMTHIMRSCAQVYVPCGGPMIRSMRAAGVKHIRYAPSCASGTRFPHVWSARGAHEHDIVVVGNRVSSRVPFKTMPGARRRRILVDALVRRYGQRVAVYGNGWTGPNAMGPLPFDEQQRVYRSSLLSVGVNNSTYPYVFSNRLPIALACGVPLLYHRNRGFDRVFPPALDRMFFDDELDLFERIDHGLDAGTAALDAVSRGGRRFFDANLTKVLVARFVVSQAMDSHDVPLSSEPILWQQLQALSVAETGVR